MFPGRNLTNLLNIPRIINSLNNTLDVTKRIIPIYKEAKPMISNIRDSFNKLKKYANNNVIEHAHNNTKNVKEKINTIKSVDSNNPQFFQ